MDSVQTDAPAGVPASPRVAVTAIFLSPSRSFEEISKGASWFWPFLVCAVLGVFSALLAGPAQDVIWQGQVAQIQQRNPDITPEALERMHTFSKVLQFVGTPVILLAILALCALVFFLLFLVFGVGLGFAPVFRGLAYASLISYGGYTLLGSIMTYLKARAGKIEGPADIVPALGLDLAFPNAEGFARGILNVLNIFTAWWLVVLVYGFAVLARRPRGKVIVPVLLAGALWLLFTGWLASLQFARAG